MNCRSAETLYSAFIEDELSQKERRDLEAHLLGCRHCSAAVRELRATIALTQSLPAAEASAHFEEDILSRIRSGEALRPSMLDWLAGLFAPVRLRPALVASAGVCAVSIAAFVLLRAPAPAPETAPGPAPTVAMTGPPADGAAGSPPSVSPAPGDAAGRESRTVTGSPTPTASVRTTESAGTVRRYEPELIQSPLALENARSIGDSLDASGRPLEPQYQDEYILDQFYLERVPVSRDPSVVPASGNPSDDVYIVF